MSKRRLILILITVSILTIGIHSYYRLSRLYQKQIARELGSNKTPGFTEMLLADGRLVSKDKPVVQGNQPDSLTYGQEFLEQALHIVREHRTMPAGRDHLGLPEPRVYCLVYGSSVVFLTYIPTFGNWPEEEQQQLAQKLWPVAQAMAANAVDGHPTVGLALRNHRVYGPIFIGGKRDEPLFSQTGGRYVLYPYFYGEPSLQLPGTAPDKPHNETVKVTSEET